jgi:hypothetical protein
MEKNDVAIAAPCTADWRKMTPADGGRFCGDCKKVVRDLSTMRERDARTLLRSAQNGELCVRYLYDKHGKIFFAGDRPDVQLVPASLLARAKRVALSAAAIAVPLSLAACSPSAADATSSSSSQDLQNQELYENMGGAPSDPRDHDEPKGDGGAEGGDAGVQGDGGADGDASADAGLEAETPI